ncbi:gp47 recombination endonuclease subunit [Delftia phage PhiW-14]|uniref:Gp47 recombination endonuclease subunit n=1 Tax=Delftia phage PhiW-14 TaxID=665032 RepID=C9DGJ7_BPW14|nr:gp47 recombination endonuclease subunit [Delftia phage PhiW-14]ACV50248.1 gp47 recombination endonuclease subunit [Delftia phage PhiW-14]
MSQYNTQEWAIVGDCHFDVRGGDERFLEFQINWFASMMHQAHARGIKRIVQMGDFLDNRKQTRSHVIYHIAHKLLPLLNELDMELILLVGNHNIYYRDSNHIHNMLWMQANPRIRIIEENEEVDGVLMLAWINSKNLESQMAAVERSTSKFCFGHLELVDMPMYRGVMAKDGMSPAPFAKFKRTLTGHYHTVSEYQNILCVGSPFHLTWADYPDSTNRGWFVFNRDTGDTTMIKNKPGDTMFAVWLHDPELASDEALGKQLKEELGGKIVKLIIEDRGDTRRFNKFIEMLKAVPVIDLNILDQSIMTKEEREEIQVDVEAIKSNTDVLKAVVEYSGRLSVSERAKLLIPGMAATLYQKAQK